VVQPRGRDVLLAERGHPPRPSDQRAQHVRQRHEGKIHQAHAQEGLEIREQVRQTSGEGRQIRIRQSTKGQGQVKKQNKTTIQHPESSPHRHQQTKKIFLFFISIPHCDFPENQKKMVTSNRPMF